jgi:quinone-modifying oxidoreductase, subunit QmoC
VTATGSRIDPDLHRDIAAFGGRDVSVCMNCGNCTAVCQLSTDSTPFPRRIVHLLQVGHREKLLASAEPWLCYYCGECSDSCPRQANPGETMMAARRYLTASYDWTGLARWFYVSPASQIGAMAALALFVVTLFALFHGPVVTDRVELNTFAPVEWIEVFDWMMGGLLAVLLLSNAWRMASFILGPDTRSKLGLSLLLAELRTFFVHLATQKRWRECERQQRRWVTHLLLVSGYVTMIGLVEGGLRWFQTDEIYPLWHPTRVLGYYATAVLLYGSAVFLVGRWRKREAIHRSSEPTDWVFLALLFVVAFTGILVHAFRLTGLPLTTYATYVIHMAFVVPFLVVQVPFGKWSHILYRPLAVYLVAVRERVRGSREPDRAGGVERPPPNGPAHRKGRFPAGEHIEA